jgi:hypothetical protein
MAFLFLTSTPRHQKALNDIVVLVAHGGSIARIINELMADASPLYR